MITDDFAAGSEEMRCGVLAAIADAKRRAGREDIPDDALCLLEDLADAVRALPAGRQCDMRAGRAPEVDRLTAVVAAWRELAMAHEATAEVVDIEPPYDLTEAGLALARRQYTDAGERVIAAEAKLRALGEVVP